MNRNGIQKSIDQLGIDTVSRYLPRGMKLHDCPVHGKFVAHYHTKDPMCPLCQVPSTNGNGVTASDIELFIDLKSAVQKELASKEVIVPTATAL